jgi:hypothetical protein
MTKPEARIKSEWRNPKGGTTRFVIRASSLIRISVFVIRVLTPASLNGLLFDVQQEGAWLPLVEKIVSEHVHPGERRKLDGDPTTP